MAQDQNQLVSGFGFVAALIVAGSLLAGSGPSTHPAASQPAREQAAKVRRVEVTLPGKIGDVKGVKWPSDPTADLWVEEPCELIVHLAGGKTVSLRTRPILIISRSLGLESGHILEADAPPDDKPASLADKVHEIDDLLAKWHAVPDKHMRALLNELKNPRADIGLTGGRFLIADLRVGGAQLDEQVSVMFEIDCNSLTGRWNLRAIFGPNDVSSAVTRSSSRPVLQP